MIQTSLFFSYQECRAVKDLRDLLAPRALWTGSKQAELIQTVLLGMYRFLKLTEMRSLYLKIGIVP